MARPFKLADLQLILLAAAAQRTDGNLLPPPEQVSDQDARIRKAIPRLLKQTLVEETSVTDPTCSWWQDGDLHMGLLITNAGWAKIAFDETEAAPKAPVVIDVPVGAEAVVMVETNPPRRPAGQQDRHGYAAAPT